jgi:hypothetical protein
MLSRHDINGFAEIYKELNTHFLESLDSRTPNTISPLFNTFRIMYMWNLTISEVTVKQLHILFGNKN